MKKFLQIILKIFQILFEWCFKCCLNWGLIVRSSWIRFIWAGTICKAKYPNQQQNKLRILFWIQSKYLKIWGFYLISFQRQITVICYHLRKSKKVRAEIRAQRMHYYQWSTNPSNQERDVIFLKRKNRSRLQ